MTLHRIMGRSPVYRPRAAGVSGNSAVGTNGTDPPAMDLAVASGEVAIFGWTARTRLSTWDVYPSASGIVTVDTLTGAAAGLYQAGGYILSTTGADYDDVTLAGGGHFTGAGTYRISVTGYNWQFVDAHIWVLVLSAGVVDFASGS